MSSYVIFSIPFLCKLSEIVSILEHDIWVKLNLCSLPWPLTLGSKTNPQTVFEVRAGVCVSSKARAVQLHWSPSSVGVGAAWSCVDPFLTIIHSASKFSQDKNVSSVAIISGYKIRWESGCGGAGHLAFRRQRQEDCKFDASLSNILSQKLKN